MTDLENHTVPPETHESWRAWLMTGARRTPVDKRRLRGANRGLKKILVEGLTENGDHTHRWQDFSGAMVRHAVDDAMRNLPPEERRVIKLAYFGGFSNREIANEVGATEWAVQRRLRRALAAVSDYIQHGQALGRRALCGLGLFLSGRWLTEHVWTATAVASAAVVVAASSPAPAAVHHSPAPVSHAAASAGGGADKGGAPAPRSAPQPVPVDVQGQVQSAAQSLPVPVTLPAVKVPKIKVPPLKNLL